MNDGCKKEQRTIMRMLSPNNMHTILIQRMFKPTKKRKTNVISSQGNK
jgi:hypothetical protein